MRLALRFSRQQLPASTETDFPLAKERGGRESRCAVQSANHVNLRHRLGEVVVVVINRKDVDTRAKRISGFFSMTKLISSKIWFKLRCDMSVQSVRPICRARLLICINTCSLWGTNSATYSLESRIHSR